MEKITATLSLTKAQWAIVTLSIHNVAPMIPSQTWDVTDEIEKAFDKALEEAAKEVA
tara:strand:- start:318 stop:488 length:171 start_codon:yes stop_codon:yes gene_type:complete